MLQLTKIKRYHQRLKWCNIECITCTRKLTGAFLNASFNHSFNHGGTPFKLDAYYPCSWAVLVTSVSLATNAVREHGCHFLTPVFTARQRG